MTKESRVKLIALQGFLDICEIKYFNATELVSGLNDTNTVPPKVLWNNIIPTLQMLDSCRIKFGKIKINSCYRNNTYNIKVGGSSRSLHKDFKACDITPLESRITDVCEWLNNHIPVESWGLRYYPKKNFIHIDCRGYKYREI